MQVPFFLQSQPSNESGGNGPIGGGQLHSQTENIYVKIVGLANAGSSYILPSYYGQQVFQTPGGQYEDQAAAGGVPALEYNYPPTSGYSPTGAFYNLDGNADLPVDGSLIVRLRPRYTWGLYWDSTTEGADEWEFTTVPASEGGIPTYQDDKGNSDTPADDTMQLNNSTLTDAGGGPAVFQIDYTDHAVPGIIDLDLQKLGDGQKVVDSLGIIASGSIADFVTAWTYYPTVNWGGTSSISNFTLANGSTITSPSDPDITSISFAAQTVDSDGYYGCTTVSTGAIRLTQSAGSDVVMYTQTAQITNSDMTYENSDLFALVIGGGGGDGSAAILISSQALTYPKSIANLFGSFGDYGATFMTPNVITGSLSTIDYLGNLWPGLSSTITYLVNDGGLLGYRVSTFVGGLWTADSSTSFTSIDIPFVAGNPANWGGISHAPVTLEEAINRLADWISLNFPLVPPP